MSRITDTVKTLLIANVLFFLGYQLVGEQAIQYLALWFPENEHFRIWQPISHMFMHATVGHIFFNMFALWMFGSVLEHSIGQSRFLFIYFSAGLGAVLLQLGFTYYNFNAGFEQLSNAGLSPDEIYAFIHKAVDSNSFRVFQGTDESTIRSMIGAYATPMVGASGAIFGVLAAFAIIYPNLPLYIIFIPIPIKAKYLIGGYFFIEVFSGVTNSSLLGPSNTAHWAHVGGAVVGFIVMWYWKKHQANQRFM